MRYASTLLCESAVMYTYLHLSTGVLYLTAANVLTFPMLRRWSVIFWSKAKEVGLLKNSSASARFSSVW